MAKRKLPFWIYPAHWGLSGQALELAKIDYSYEGLEAELKRADVVYLTPFDRETAKLDILYNVSKDAYEYNIKKNKLNKEHDKIDEKTYNQTVIEIDYKFNKISEQERDSKLIEIMIEGEEKHRAALDFAHKYHEITQTEYDKEIKTLAKEPWFEFNVDYDEEGNDVVLTFDYNEYFWKKLKQDGHPGNDEFELIDNFIRDWGRKLATEDYADENSGNLTSLNETDHPTGISDGGFKIYE